MSAAMWFRIFCLPICCLKTLTLKIYKSVILPVVLYGCRNMVCHCKKKRLKVFKNMRMFGPRSVEVTGNEKKLHMRGAIVCTLPSNIRVSKSRRLRWAGHVAHREDEKCAQNFGQKAKREETALKT
jgi:hypothetical protein